MDLENVQAAIQRAYARGGRLAAALDVEGGVSDTVEAQVPVQRQYLCFFQEAPDLSQGQQHQVFISTMSRLREEDHRCCGGESCCAPPNEMYDTHLMRQAWEAAGQHGWHVASMFDTGTEVAPTGYHRGRSRFKDSMIVFDAPGARPLC
eukprot:TRINITY_DN6957_c0_g1_i5.p1 TRINITY_DN6957_c0_g1~~TRINITY_DN6957_c0_g1_i5.p1  ORF type:complete len:149 (-),score=11.78 TRINITY_DN6957_c0_g1_i5:635-1081(-)